MNPYSPAKDSDLTDFENQTTDRKLQTSSSNMQLGHRRKRMLKILNLDLVMNMASADFVIFDKTDTLTQGDMRVCRLATVHRDYGFVSSEEVFDKMLEDSRRNQSKYLMSDSDEEAELEDESDYSEKSQETIRELECDYIQSLMDENMDENKEIDLMLAKKMSNANTLTKKLSIFQRPASFTMQSRALPEKIKQ